MTAPLFLVAPGALDDADVGSLVEVVGAEARHAVQVRRVAVGELVDVADGAGVRAIGRVSAVDPATPRLTVRVSARETEPEPRPRLVLVQALAKGDRDLSAVESATELGVDAVVPWQAERSVVVWRGDRAAKSLRRWEATARAAAKQARRSRVPDVHPVVTTSSLVELVEGAALTLVLHEEATEPLGGVDLPQDGDVLLVVGPEGGLSPKEVDQLVAAGGRPVRLGSTVLRSSTAGPAAVAVLSARTRWA